jgi:hypothetical protein
MELLDSAKNISSEKLYEAVEDKVFNSLPKESQVLFAETGPGQNVSVLDTGSHAIKFIDPKTGLGHFTYDKNYTFLPGDGGQVIARKGSVEYLVKPIFENGKLSVEMDEVGKVQP